MLKTMKSGVTYSYPLDRKSKIKCEGYRGSYTIIDAASCEEDVFVLLEHNFYGDETACLLALLPLDCLRWYVVEKDGKQTKCFFVQSENIIAETWDSIIDTLSDDYPQTYLDGVEFWTDEEIDNMEVM